MEKYDPPTFEVLGSLSELTLGRGSGGGPGGPGPGNPGHPGNPGGPGPISHFSR
jgi:hypothetical protein